MGAEQVFGSTAERCGLVFLQTSEPYEAIPVILDEESMYWGRVLCRHGLNRMRECLDANDWPGVGAELISYSYPPSMLLRFDEMQENNQLPSV